MNNTFIKRLALVLCLLISLIFVFGCNKGGEEPPIEPPVDEVTPPSETNYDYVFFGSYPQSAVTNESINQALSSLIGNYPSQNDLEGWTDYEHYILGQKESYAFYKDVTLDGEKYRAVYFTKYRPYSSKLASTGLNSFQDDNGYFINTVYFFKFEPLKWRVLEEKDGEKLLLLENIIDSEPFQPEHYQSQIDGGNLKSGFSYTNYNGAPQGTFANSYEYSAIRQYLKNKFYKEAFTSLEKSNILLSTIKNDSGSAGQDPSEFSYRDTEDFVYLPSFMDIKNRDYGFKSQGEEDPLRKQPYTDYAKCQGAYYDVQGEYKWWLRSAPHFINKYSYRAQAVGNSGKIYNYHYADYTIMGVVPMMRIYAE